jgi:molybdopterin-synthase adenylyltransferase
MISEGESKRYSRQKDAVGIEGQERLKNARVLIAGAGGLGTIIATYLAAAGVGSIRIVDYDSVEESNLNRQILHWGKDIGRQKTDSAEEKLHAFNANVVIEKISKLIDGNNILDIVTDADLIVDGMDNFDARYLLNQAAIDRAIPFIHGAISGFYGQVTTIIPGRTPCLKCIFPQGPSASVFPAVGATCGVIGSIQATEAIKYITRKGDLLAGRLLFWDGLACEMNIIKVEKNQNCNYCGTIKQI